MLHKYFGLNGLDCVLKVGLLCERLSDIEGSISKVGSRDRLKLVTDELPEDAQLVRLKHQSRICQLIAAHILMKKRPLSLSELHAKGSPYPLCKSTFLKVTSKGRYT